MPPYSDHSQSPNSLNVLNSTRPFSENDDSFLQQLPAATSQETTVKPKKVRLTKELKFCREILKKLIAVDCTDCASIFFESANSGFRLVPNSDEVIKKPMDLVTIKNKLENGEYKTAEEFAIDVEQIFRINSAAYSNGIRIRMARKLQHVFEIEFAKMPDTFPESDDDDSQECEKESGLSAQQPQQQVPQQTETPAHRAPPPLSAAQPPLIQNITTRLGSLNLANNKHAEEVLRAGRARQQVHQQVQDPTHLIRMAQSANAEPPNTFEDKVNSIFTAMPSKNAEMPRDSNTFHVSSKSSGCIGDSKKAGEVRFRAKQTRQQYPRPYVPQALKINYAEVPQQFKAPTHETDMTTSVNSEQLKEFDEMLQKYLQKYFQYDNMPRETTTFCASSKSSCGSGEVKAPPQPIDMTQSSNAVQPNPYDGSFNLACSYAKMLEEINKFGVHHKSSNGTGDRREGSEAQKTRQHVPRQFQAPTHTTDKSKYGKAEQQIEYEERIRIAQYLQCVNNIMAFKMSKEPFRAPSTQQRVPAPSHPIRITQSANAELPNPYKDLDNHPLLRTSNVRGSNSNNTFSPFAGTSSLPKMHHTRLTEPLPHHMPSESTRKRFRYEHDHQQFPPTAFIADLVDSCAPLLSDAGSSSFLRLDCSPRESVDQQIRKILNRRGNLPVPPSSSYSNFLNPDPFLSSTTRAHPFAHPSRELEERACAIFQKPVIRMVMRHVFEETGRYPETLEHLCDEILMYEGIKPKPAAVSLNNMCKLCTVNRISTAFQPCGHKIACKECAMYYTTSNCIICSKEINAISINQYV